MASSPLWKVYNADKEYRAACKAVEEAAVLVAFFGDGATIRCDHTLILWTEGKEEQPAAESYDHVAEVVSVRLDEHRAKRRYHVPEKAELQKVELHKCAGKNCPGLPYKASERGHPGSCV